MFPYCSMSRECSLYREDGCCKQATQGKDNVLWNPQKVSEEDTALTGRCRRGRR